MPIVSSATRGGGSQTLGQVLAVGNDGGAAGMVNTGTIATGGSALNLQGGGVDTGGGPIDTGSGVLDLGGGGIANAFDGNFADDVNIGGALNQDGTAVGFYGVAPAAQPAIPVTLGDVIDGLQALGLFAS